MKRINPAGYLVVDLEGTCCDDGSILDDEREAIEIGALILDGKHLSCRREFSQLIKPTRHPILTDFCVGLTGIQQSDINTAAPFPVVFGQFCEWIGTHLWPAFCSWGSYDTAQLARDCNYHKQRFPLRDSVDVARLFRKETGRRRGRRGALRFFGLKPTGNNHRGLSDATDVMQILRELLQ